MIGPRSHIFRPADGTPEDQWDAAVLRRHDMFFGPFTPQFAKRAGDVWTKYFLATMVPKHERRPFKNIDPEEIPKVDTRFSCAIMKIDPEGSTSARQLLQDPWLAE